MGYEGISTDVLGIRISQMEGDLRDLAEGRREDVGVDLIQHLKDLRKEKARREAEAKKTVGQRVAEDIVTGKADCGNGRLGVMFDLGCGPYECKTFSLSGATPRTAPDILNAIAAAVDKVRADTIEECVVAVDQVNVCTSVGRNVLNTAITEIRRLVLK